MSNDYPREGELQRIKDWDVIGGNLQDFISYLESIWHLPEWGFRVHRGREHLFKRWCMKLELHTGGWSGNDANEDIIGTLQQNYFWTLFWQKSVRGGHYYFEFPIDRWRRNA